MATLVEIFDPKENKIGTVPSRNLGAALEKGYQLHNAGKETKIFDPNTKKNGTVPTENLAMALKKGYRLAESDFTDYGQAIYQGGAVGLGKLADTAVAAGNAINAGVGRVGGYLADKVGANDVSSNLNQFADESADTARDYWKNDKIAGVASDLFDTGLEHEKGIRVAKASGEMAASLPAFSAVGKGVQFMTKAGRVAEIPLVSNINKFLQTPLTGKNAVNFAAMGAGGEALKDDDPNAHPLVNLGRQLTGALLGGLTVQGAIHGASATFRTLGNLVSREKWYEFLVKRGDTTLDKEAIEATKAIGGKLDAKTIYKSNDTVTYLEKAFANKAFDTAAKNADESTIAYISKTLDQELGVMPKGNETESTIRTLTTDTEDMLGKLHQERNAQNDALYEAAFSKVKPTDQKPTPTNTLKAAEEVFNKTYAPSTTGTTDTGQGVTSSTMRKLIDAWKGQENVTYQEIINQTRALKEQRRLAGSGYSKMFSSVEAAIEKDIGLVNPEFLKEYKIASKDFAENITPFFQLDAARSLMSGEKPNFIWEHMNTSGNRAAVKEALEIGGENGKRLYDTIRRAKAQSVILENIQQDGAFKPDKFIELFTKLKPEDEIIDLISKETYNKIKDNIMPLARKMKDVSSQTARIDNTLPAQFLNKGGSTLSAAGVGATALGTVGGIPGVIGGAAVGALAKNWIASGFAKASQNPQVIARLIAAAKNGNDKQFMAILQRMFETTTGAIKEAGKTSAKTQGITGAAKLVNSNVEENKNKPKAPAFNKTIEDMYNNKYIRNFIEAD